MPAARPLDCAGMYHLAVFAKTLLCAAERHTSLDLHRALWAAAMVAWLQRTLVSTSHRSLELWALAKFLASLVTMSGSEPTTNATERLLRPPASRPLGACIAHLNLDLSSDIVSTPWACIAPSGRLPWDPWHPLRRVAASPAALCTDQGDTATHALRPVCLTLPPPCAAARKNRAPRLRSAGSSVTRGTLYRPGRQSYACAYRLVCLTLPPLCAAAGTNRAHRLRFGW